MPLVVYARRWVQSCHSSVVALLLIVLARSLDHQVELDIEPFGDRDVLDEQSA